MEIELRNIHKAFGSNEVLKGVNLKAISDKYDVNIDEIYGKAFEELIQKGYLEQKELNVRLTPSGLLMANEVFEQFLLSI